MKIRVIEKESNKEMIFDSVLSASEFTGIDRRKITKAIADPFNWVHQKGIQRVKSDGTISVKRGGCPYDFYKVEGEHSVELWPVDDFHDSQKFDSLYKAAQYLGVSKMTLHRIRQKSKIGEPYSVPIVDKEGYSWLIIFNKDIQDVPEEFKHSKK